jgi:hypothetical protein
MSPKPSNKTSQIPVRVDPEVIARLDAVAAKLSRPGLELSRTDAVRIALLEGLARIEQAEGIGRRK